MEYRTDLAIEFQKTAQDGQIESKKYGKTEVFFQFLEKDNNNLKKKGKYITIKVGNISLLPDYSDIEKAIISCLEKLLPEKRENVLVAGLGNREITSDNIGPLVASKILATRHIKDQFSKIEGLEKLKSVTVITPSVLGKTGVEASEVIDAVAKKIKPDCIIVIDALCANSIENLFSVIQLCDSGISPGSGVKNARKEISYDTLGIPTVALGVPTVIEADVMARELSKNENLEETQLLVTPKDADLLSLNISQAISSALNLFLQPEIDREIILSLV